MLEKLIQDNITPEILTDQTSAHDPINGYVPNGLTLEEVRRLYIDGTGGQPMNVANDPWCVFLVADAQVLQDSHLGLLKVVAADYDSIAAAPRNGLPQKYFGWITMPSATVVDLWGELDTYYLWQIVNFTAGGPGAYWDVDEIY